MFNVSVEGITLQVEDVERSLAFYTKIPDSHIVAHRPGQFALVQLGKGRIGLLNRKYGGPSHIEIETRNIDGLYERLRELGIASQEPPSRKPWDAVRDFVITDPDGNVLEFGEAHTDRKA
jgi:catechol 2,3-dioxygenase-like lactoylglutathione lyase family enzyme